LGQSVNTARDVGIIDAFEGLERTARDSGCQIRVTDGAVAHPAERREVASEDCVAHDPQRRRREARCFGNWNQCVVAGFGTLGLRRSFPREARKRVGRISKRP
jgi:hypothetical protein